MSANPPPVPLGRRMTVALSATLAIVLVVAAIAIPAAAGVRLAEAGVAIALGVTALALGLRAGPTGVMLAFLGGLAAVISLIVAIVLGFSIVSPSVTTVELRANGSAAYTVSYDINDKPV